MDSSKLLGKGRLLAQVGSAQVLIQLLSLFSGILIIHQLTTKEYALYTLVNTMLGTLTVLTDGGVSLAVMAEGGKVYQDREQLGVVLSTGMRLRKRFAIVALIVVFPVLFYFLYSHSAGVLFSILLLLALVPAFYAALSDSLLEVAPKLRQDLSPLQRNLIEASLGRVVMISATLIIFPYAFIAILMNGIARQWANIKLRKITTPYVNYSQKPDKEIEKRILKVVKRSLPEGIYYCISGQLTIWLVSILGTTNSIAEIGAIGRLSTTLILFSSIISILIVPRFARINNDYKKLMSFFVKVQVGVLLLCVAIMGFVYLFSTQLLWILGKQYSGLDYYLVLNFLGSCISLLGGSIFLMYLSRGWILRPVILIPFNIVVLVIGVILFSPSTLEGVLKLNAFIAVMQLLMHLTFALYKILVLKGDVESTLNEPVKLAS